MDQLINKLKKEDRRNYVISKRFQVLYWIMTPLYFALLVINPDPDLTLNERLEGTFFVLSFISFALIFRHMKKSYGEIDYSLPLVVMLEQAVKRYKFWQLKTGLAFIPMILMSIGLGIAYYDRVKIADPVLRIVVIEGVIWGVFILAFLVGVAIWYVKQKPLRDRALQMLCELHS